MRSSARARSSQAKSPPLVPKRAKPARAKLFRNGASQAVRLPKALRFDNVTEVLVRREGKCIILEPVDEWSEEFLACLGSLDEDVPRLKQGTLKDLRDPFA